MALQPTMIYSRRLDPRGVLALLRTLDPEVQVAGSDEDWKAATLTLTQPGVSGPLTLTFSHDPESYDGDDWPRQGGLAIPTWLYGHEPANLFAGRIAKYFSNAIREDMILRLARGGIGNGDVEGGNFPILGVDERI